MDFSLPDEILREKQQARKWVAEVLDPMSKLLESDELLPEELVGELRSGRFFGLTIPKKYGGQGWSAVRWFTVLEELAKAYAAVRLLAHSMNGLLWRPLFYFGSEEQKSRYLPKLAEGEIWAANCLSEPEAGTDEGLNSKAAMEGDHYLLNGHKWLVTLFPGYTKLLYAYATTEEGITSFLVDLPNEGLSLNAMPKMMGCVGPRHYNVIYKNCRVPAANVLGEKGRGEEVAFTMLHMSRVSIAFCCVGLAQKCLDLAVAYSKKRVTHGKRLFHRQAVQNNLAQMGTEIEASRLLAYQAAWRFDQGLDIAKHAAMAKLFAEQMVTRVSELALRTHGGIGYTQAFDLERHFRDARAFHFEGGTEEIQKLLIASHILAESSS